jgi:hypothetical protein
VITQDMVAESKISVSDMSRIQIRPERSVVILSYLVHTQMCRYMLESLLKSKFGNSLLRLVQPVQMVPRVAGSVNKTETFSTNMPLLSHEFLAIFKAYQLTFVVKFITFY